MQDEFPICSILKEVSALQDQEFGGNKLCCDRIQLIFQDAAVILQPLADTDEIEIVLSSLPSLLDH